MVARTSYPPVRAGICGFLGAVTLVGLHAFEAREARAEAAGDPAATVQAAPDSPRAAVAAFLDLARTGSYEEAALYLDLPSARQGEGPRLARRLKAVLDHHLWVDLDSLSPRPEGETGDGLPPGTDELGSIEAASGAAEHVRLVRRDDERGGRWVFSAATTSRVDRLYATLPDRWIRERLPDVLLRPGPGDLLLWQWLGLLILLPVAWVAARTLGWLTRRAAERITRHTRTSWDDSVVHGLGGPITLAWALLVVRMLTPWLGLYSPAQHVVSRTLGAGVLVTLFWALFQVVGFVGSVLKRSEWGLGNAGAQSLFSIGIRMGQVTVLAMGLIAALSHLGYPVASLLAGLGIGGLALALAAQKTVEHLFGSVSLAVDQPVRVGDFVRIDDFVGTVERIGLRSTQVRTLDRTVVTIPNGVLADKRLESFSARDRMRLACTVGLIYDTSVRQMREVLEGLERVLREHPRIWPDAVVVRFKEFGASSLDIEVMAWFQTRDWGAFQLMRQEVLLRFMEVVEKAGTSFAFPTRTVHLAGGVSAGPPSEAEMQSPVRRAVAART